MFDRNEIMEVAQKQLAIECSCSVNDFDKIENIITFTTSTNFNNKRRQFTNKPAFFRMTTTGGNAVISADEQLHKWLHKFIENKRGHELFKYRNLKQIDKELEHYNEQLFQTHHMFLPLGQSKQIAPVMSVKWYEQDEIQKFYQSRKFPNAISSQYSHQRPDVLAVAAMDDGEIIGLAGCSADTPIMWQIGIDVNENYRGKGIGTMLVSMLKNEISARGKIPYYGTSLSNIHSWNIALNCGFRPSWIDVETEEW